MFGSDEQLEQCRQESRQRVAQWRESTVTHKAVGRGDDDRKAASKAKRAEKAFRGWTETITAEQRAATNAYWDSVTAEMERGAVAAADGVLSERERNEFDVDSYEVE